MEFAALRRAVQLALRYWGRDSHAGNPLGSLQLFESYQRDATSIRSASNKLLKDALVELAEMHPKEAALLHERFMVGVTVTDAAKQRNVAASTLYNWQRSAITHLAEIIAGWDARQQKATSPTTSLFPMSALNTDYLAGEAERAAPLLALLQHRGAPWLICLSGLGGVGKSTLANYLARTLLADGDVVAVAWIGAQSQRLAPDGTLHETSTPTLTPEGCVRALALQLLDEEGNTALTQPFKPLATAMLQRLKDAPHLIVVDRIDLVPDNVSLLSLLQEFAAPSKILVTARYLSDDAHFLHRYQLRELEREQALDLIRCEAERLGFEPLSTAREPVLDQLYAVVGGNPLALQVVVDLVRNFGLERTIDTLQTARCETIERLYEHIYRDLWQELDDLARHTLLALPDIDQPSVQLQHVAEMVDASLREVYDALTRLIDVGLVESEGDINERAYTIRPLTRNFAMGQAHQW